MRKSSMDDAIRRRLQTALDATGLDPRKVSKDAGFNALYIFEVLNPKRPKGTLERMEKIAKEMGVSWAWMKDGVGEMLASAPVKPPLERESVLLAIEAVLDHFLVAERADVRALASTILAVSEIPPDGRFGNDIPSKIRNGIGGALLLFELQLKK